MRFEWDDDKNLANRSGDRPIKTQITLRLDVDLLAWFRAQGRGYQTRINEALREHMKRNLKSA